MSDGFGPLRCLDEGRHRGCGGEVELRAPLSGTGVPFARCAVHWAKRVEEQRRIRRRYPRTAPAGFDPAFAGERWEDDDGRE